MSYHNNKVIQLGIFMALFILMSVFVLPTQVEWKTKGENGFVLRTGEYTVSYNQPTLPESKNQILIFYTSSKQSTSKAIGTVIVNGDSLKPTNSSWDKKISYAETDTTLTVTFITRTTWGQIESQLVAYKEYPGLIRTSAEITPTRFLILNDNPLEYSFLEGGHRVKKYFAQAGPAAGMLYFYDRDMDSSILYFQDYTSLNDLYRLTGFENPYYSGTEKGWSEGPVTMKVWGEPDPYSVYFTSAPAPVPVEKTYTREEIITGAGEFGYERPTPLKIASRKKVCLSDSYLYLTPGFDNKSSKFCKRFVDMLGVVYRHIRKPEMETVDWKGDVLPKVVNDLNNPVNWRVPANGTEYLSAYVKDKRGPYGELVTQLEILPPLAQYVNKHPENKEAAKLADRLAKTIPTFWDDSARTFSDGIPPVSSSQSGWYYFFPGEQMHDLALTGNKDAIRMFAATRDTYLKIGKQFNYQFAIFNWNTGEESHVYEYDVTGLYLNLMIDYYEMSWGKDTECLEVAKKCADIIAGHEFRYGYELLYTPTGSIGLYRLFQATGNERYKELAYIPLANTLRWACLWECDYGVGEQVKTFWSVCATPANHCIAECENHHCRRYLRDYYRLASKEMTPEVRELISDSWKYGPLQSYYTLPPVMIKSGAKWSLVKEGSEETASGVQNQWEIDYKMWIPLEDAHAGWCREPNWFDKNPKNGTVGQEIYGAGGLFWYALWQEEDK